MSKTFFTVMKKWQEPDIRTVVTDEYIAVCLDADEFSKILADEVFWKPCLTKASFAKRTRAVMEKVRQVMQKETAKVSS